MDSKIEVLLGKTNIDKEYYQYFCDSKLSKIVVNKKTNDWNIYIDKDELLPLNVFEQLQDNRYLLDENSNNISIIFNISNPNYEIYLEYYKYLLKQLKEDLKVLEIYEDCLRLEDNFLVLVVSNEVEKERLEAVLPKIEKFYKQNGYNFNIDINDIGDKLCDVSINITSQSDIHLIASSISLIVITTLNGIFIISA